MKPATPLPWLPHNMWIGGNAKGPYAYPVGVDSDTAAQNAAYIAHACNAYPKLVEALLAEREEHKRFIDTDGYHAQRISSINALLAELGEQS
jgi:hypothetical protein